MVEIIRSAEPQVLQKNSVYLEPRAREAEPGEIIDFFNCNRTLSAGSYKQNGLYYNKICRLTMGKIREILRSNVWKWKSYKIAFIFGAALFFISFAVLVNPAQQNITLNELGNLDRFNKRTVQDASGI